MPVHIARLLSLSNTCLNLPFRYLAGHVPRRYVQEFPGTRFDNSAPKDYLLVLPEKLNETNNELLRIPQQGESEVNLVSLNAETCFKGLSQAICTFENYVTDVNNQVSPPYSSLDELFKDIEKHLFPMDFAHNILMVLRTIDGKQYAYKEIMDLIKRYQNSRETRLLGAFRESIRIHMHDKGLSQCDKKMLKIYHVNPLKQSGTRKLDEMSLHLIQKNLDSDLKAFILNLNEASQLFAPTIDDPDILAAVSSEFGDCHDLHHRERTPLQINTGTYHKFMQVCPDRFVRQMMWKTYNKRCSPKGLPKHNNTVLIKNIRILRRKISDLTGHRSHVDFRLDDTMASSRQRVMESLQAINQDNRPKLNDRLQELYEFAADNRFEDPSNLGLREYDIDYWSHRYMHDILIGVSESDLRGFFPFKAVMGGIQNYFNKFFSIEFKQNQDDNFWSKDVQRLEVGRKGQPLGIIIYDSSHSSPLKPYHMTLARLRSRVEGAGHLPAYFISTPFKANPASGELNLSAGEVISLLYYFSEVIQKLMYNYPYYELNTDGALEHDVKDLLPNLCMAHLLSDHKILQSCSSRGGSKPIDSELASRILKAFTYVRPFKTWFELYKAHLDLESHTLLSDTHGLATDIYAKYSPFSRDPDNYDYCAMNDIYVGPNDGIQHAGLWSRQLANFCLSHVQEPNGKLDDAKTKDFYDRLVESLLDSNNLNTNEKLTALVGEGFQPSKTTLGVL